jgi:hypothetical protein
VPGASFAQVLNRLIDECPRPCAGPAITTSPLDGTPLVDRRCYYSAFTNAAMSSGPRRALSARHRSALDRLRSAGAVDLADDFLIGELRAAFRRLARTAHPDMHPAASVEERRRLGAQFCEIQESYRVLLDGSQSGAVDRPS